MIIVFLGPPGSGKGTQAGILSREHDFRHFDAGSLLRAEVESGSELGEEIAGYINQGRLVPIEIIGRITHKFLAERQAARTMFDGFPRNLEQAALLTSSLRELGQELDHVLYLHIDEDDLLQRIVNRRVCRNCRRIYNLVSNPPQQPCSETGKECELYQREDDSEDVFGRRLRIYLEETVPILRYYEAASCVRLMPMLTSRMSVRASAVYWGWPVMVRLKSREDIAGIWRSGQIAGALLLEMREHIRPGAVAADINRIAGEFIARHDGTPAFLGYNGFPGNICFSINTEIVHGIPTNQVVEEGDIVTIDVGVVLNGYISDTAYTYRVGNGQVPEDMQRLLTGTEKSLYSGINALEAGKPMRLASRAVEQELRQHGLGVIRELTGHGVGFELHEEPTFYNFDPGNRRPIVENGMVIAIEPMATLGSEKILLASDDWTYKTMDGSLSAHYEHTVAVWNGKPYILTQPGNEEAAAEFGS